MTQRLQWVTRRLFFLALMALVNPLGTLSSNNEYRRENRTLLVSTIDGYLYALALKDGRELWKLQSSPLVSTTFQSEDPSNGEKIIAGIDGSLYSSNIDGIRKHSQGIREIVEAPPSHSGGTRFMVRKANSVLLISKRSGKVLDMFTMDGDSEGNCPVNSEEEVVWVAKTEFTVQAIDSSSLRRRWNVSYGEYSSFFASESQGFGSQHEIPSPTPETNLPQIGVTVSGELFCAAHTDALGKGWNIKFDSPVAAVHLIGSGNDIVKIPHVYLHEVSTKNMDSLNQELIFVGNAGKYGLYAISNAGFSDENGSVMNTAKNWKDLLAAPEHGKDDDIKVLPIESSSSTLVPSNNWNMPLSVHVHEESKTLSDCVAGTEGYPQCLYGFHVVNIPYQSSQIALSLSSNDGAAVGSRIPSSKPSIGIYLRKQLDAIFSPLGMLMIGAAMIYVVRAIARQKGNESENKAEELKLKTPPRSNAKNRRKRNGNRSRNSSRNSSRNPSPAVVSDVRRGKGRKRHHIHLGKMRVFTNQVLGRGSSGTIVFTGLWDGRKVAVKRLLKDAAPDPSENADAVNIEKEIQLMISSDHLPNIVRYFAKEEDGDFVYLALELCERTLHEYVIEAAFRDKNSRQNIYQTSSKGKVITQYDLVQTVKGVVSGVRQLHELNVVHRDLKPRNILLDSKGRPKIADMGLGKKLSKHRSSFDSRVCGSHGWRPAEMIDLHSQILKQPEPVLEDEDQIKRLPVRGDFKRRPRNNGTGRLTKAVDIFAAGCIVYYVLTRGKHPFGPEMEREYNILHDRKDLSGLDHFPVAKELVNAMISKNPKDRITAADAERHPLFWDDHMSLSFLQDVSDRVVKSNSFILCSMMESKAKHVVGEAWDEKIDESVLTDLGKYRKYKFSSVCDCLRVIRNKKNHYLELPDKAKSALGSMPSGFLRYFQSRFPELLIYSYATMASFYTSYYLEKPKDSKSSIKSPKKNIDFGTFDRYYSGLSFKRLENLAEQNRMLPSRGWWPKQQVWALSLT